jgi:hypothetical protein
MKYLKTFESNNEPQKGDYAIVEVDSKYYKGKIIGKVNWIAKYNLADIYVSVKFKLPDGHTFNDAFYLKDIIKFSKNKKQLEYILAADKYNI